MPRKPRPSPPERPASTPKPLTENERRFVEEYLVDLDPAQAAKRAGYPKAPGSTLGVRRRPHVVAAIEAAIAARRLRTQLTADRVLQEYARIAFADIRRIADFGSGHLKVRDGADLSDDDAAAIAQLVPAPGGRRGVRVKLYDKKSALDALARHLGLFTARGSPLGPAPPTPELDLRRPAQEARALLRERLAKLAQNGSGAGAAANGLDADSAAGDGGNGTPADE
jgi:phage terminase small subunit